MKKILLVMALSMVLPSVALAACEGGEEITGKNGQKYCVSNQTMNWWSAFAWCKANGLHLATLDEACNNQAWSSGCPNINVGINKWAWTAIASGDSAAYYVHLYNGGVSTSTRTNNSGYAFCL